MPYRTDGTSSRWTRIEAVVATGRFDALMVEDQVAVWNDKAREVSHLVEVELVRRWPNLPARLLADCHQQRVRGLGGDGDDAWTRQLSGG